MELPTAWNGLVSSILTTPVFPYLWIPHVIVMNFFLRSSLGPSAVPWSRRHPLSCFTLGIVYSFSGGLAGLFLSNKSLLTILTWSPNLYSFTLIWYLMFFSPYDAMHRLVSSLTPLLPLMFASQDWLRIATCAGGIKGILEEHPTAIAYPIVFAVITSNGFLIFKYIEQVLSKTFPFFKNKISSSDDPKHVTIPPSLCSPPPLLENHRPSFHSVGRSSPWSSSSVCGAVVRWPCDWCHLPQASHHLPYQGKAEDKLKKQY